MASLNVLVIAGSTRPSRRSPVIAKWIADLGRQHSDLLFQVVDLNDLGLTFNDEPAVPAAGKYIAASTRNWSQMVAAACAVIFVTPQYNWGYPAPLKNAIDHLYREWRGKPSIVVSYGAHGGGKCAKQLREVLEGLNMRLVETMPALYLSRARIEADDGMVDPVTEFSSHTDEVLRAIRQLADLTAQTPSS